jgi:hypothetical protein
MDQRQTFDNSKELLSLVKSISDQKLKASLLIDKIGLTRVEGFITSINASVDIANTTIIIDGSDTILLKEIIGINGVFRSDYSEC